MGERRRKKITENFSSNLAEVSELRICNPKAYIIMGRTSDLNEKQLADFELIKCHYSNIVDIISYDDLIERLQRLVSYFQAKESKDVINGNQETRNQEL